MNELIQVNQLPAYEKIADPLAWCETIGKSLQVAYNLNSPHHGTIMALTCLTENLSVSAYHKRYHSDGTMRAAAIQAEFQNRGGRIEWVNMGDDGKEASAMFSHPTHQPTPIAMRYTIEDAQRQVGEKFEKPGSNWKTNPGAMLRAALVRKAIKIIDPGIISGYDDFSDVDDQPVSPPASRAKSRKAELDALASAPTTPAPVANTTDVVDVESKPVATPESPPFEPDPQSGELCNNEQLQELVALGSKIPSPADPSRGMSIQEIAEGVRKACNVDDPKKATKVQIAKLIDRFRNQLGQK